MPTLSPVWNTSQSDLLKILTFGAGCVLLGAALTPQIYNGGMALADAAGRGEANALVTWLGEAAERSSGNYGRFFRRSLLLATVLLLGPALLWLKRGKDGRGMLETFSVSAARGHGSAGPMGGLRDRYWWVHLPCGFVLAGGLLLLSGWVMVQCGFFMWRDAEESVRGARNPHPMEIDWSGAVRKAALAGLIVSLYEELLFRGALFAIFLRAMRPVPAVLFISFVFAFVHFLEPPPGAVVEEPGSPLGGFALLGQIMARMAEPLTIIARFMVLFGAGVVLAIARLRTGSLWLPIGIHAGWIFCEQLFKAATSPVTGLPDFTRWLVGSSIKEGLLPFVMIVFTGLVIAMVSRRTKDDLALDS